MNIQEVFGQNVKYYRKKMEISQEELAFRTSLHRTYISSVELGKRNISIQNIKKIADSLNCSLPALFEENEALWQEMSE